MTFREIDEALLSLVDRETGEILDVSAFEALQMERERKAENMALWVLDLKDEIASIDGEIQRLRDRKDAAERKAKSLKRYLQIITRGEKIKTPLVSVSYRNTSSVEIADKDSVIRFAQDNNLDDDSIIDEDEEKKPPEIYKPKDYFDPDFVKRMDWYAMEILKAVNYPNLIEAHFDIKSFDLIINGGTKYDDHGKGYCAFINSVVTMMFRKYLVEHGAHAPGITIIDSPLHGMFQDVEDDAPESMKAGLFRYFCGCGDDGQLIIAENDEHVPEMDFEGLGVKLMEFSKTDPMKRHGFLLDVFR